MAPALISNSSGPRRVAREASTTALYSAAFLSGLNRILYSCSRMACGHSPRLNSSTQACVCSAICFFFSIAAKASAMISAGAFLKRPLPARRK